MKTLFSTGLATLAMALGCAGAGAADWSITDLGRLPGSNTGGNISLNDNGWVVAGDTIFSPGPGGYTATRLLNAGGQNSNNFGLRDINNANVVVGNDNSAGFGQGFVWANGIRTNLPQQPDFQGYLQSRVAGINSSGQVVGNTGDTATIWTPNGSGGYSIVGLGVTGSFGSFVGSGEGVAINNAGAGLMSQVYNSYRTGYSTGVNHTTVIPDQGIYTPIGNAINDRYEVAGRGFYNCGGYSCNHAMIWQGSSVTYLDVVRADGGAYQNSEALALNEKGQVVGAAWYAPYDQRAVIWTAGASGWGTGTPLDTLLPAGTAWGNLSYAADVNEGGQVVGLGSYYEAASASWQTHIFLLTPAVPEPADWAMLLAGLAMVGTAARRPRRA